MTSGKLYIYSIYVCVSKWFHKKMHTKYTPHINFDTYFANHCSIASNQSGGTQLCMYMKSRLFKNWMYCKSPKHSIKSVRHAKRTGRTWCDHDLSLLRPQAYACQLILHQENKAQTCVLKLLRGNIGKDVLGLRPKARSRTECARNVNVACIVQENPF